MGRGSNVTFVEDAETGHFTDDRFVLLLYNILGYLFF